MSKPLVTEIMEFFYNKEKESKYEQTLDEMVDELQNTLHAILKSQEQFQEAAHYDPSENLEL